MEENKNKGKEKKFFFFFFDIFISIVYCYGLTFSNFLSHFFFSVLYFSSSHVQTPFSRFVSMRINKLQDISDTFEGNFKEQSSVTSNWLPVNNAKVRKKVISFTRRKDFFFFSFLPSIYSIYSCLYWQTIGMVNAVDACSTVVSINSKTTNIENAHGRDFVRVVDGERKIGKKKAKIYKKSLDFIISFCFHLISSLVQTFYILLCLSFIFPFFLL